MAVIDRRVPDGAVTVVLSRSDGERVLVWLAVTVVIDSDCWTESWASAIVPTVVRTI
jgi:hypothetical protein